MLKLCFQNILTTFYKFNTNASYKELKFDFLKTLLINTNISAKGLFKGSLYFKIQHLQISECYPRPCYFDLDHVTLRKWSNSIANWYFPQILVSPKAWFPAFQGSKRKRKEEKHIKLQNCAFYPLARCFLILYFQVSKRRGDMFNTEKCKEKLDLIKKSFRMKGT